MDMRGRNNKRALHAQQEIYNMWLDNSINSTDGGGHERNIVKISKRKYHEQYDPDLSNGGIVIGEKVNKCGQPYYFTRRKIVTTTTQNLHTKLVAKGIHINRGILFRLKPFFICQSTDREMALCLCKICLNGRLYFRRLMQQAKCDEDDFCSESLPEFYTQGVLCPKVENGGLSWKCCRGGGGGGAAKIARQWSNRYSSVHRLPI